MAVLQSPESSEPVFLSARHMVGRSPGADTEVTSRAVSGEHAVFLWTGARWELRDLGSRNGTWVGERQLGPGETAALAADDEIAFGDPGERWILRSDREPTVAAWTTGVVSEGEGRLLALPDEADPQVVIELDAAHGWQLLRDGESSPVQHGDEVVIGDVAWRICIPPVLSPVPMTAELREISITQDTIRRAELDFGVSSDEEYTELRVTVGPRAVTLPPRVHHYMLLELARRRLADAADGVVEAEQGWVYTSDLRRDLRITANQYYVMSHRLRREVEELGIVDATRLIEKRTTSRQVRIGATRLNVRSL
jgi:hypothetical protein